MNETVGRPAMSGRYLWHHRAHERWENSRLCIWRLVFNPTYDGEKIKSSIVEVIKSQNVTSFAIYELLGISDILLRVWLPHDLPLARFEEAIGDALLHLDYEDSEYYEVTGLIRHWVWSTSETDFTIKDPDPLELSRKSNDAILNRLDLFFNGSLHESELSDEEVGEVFRLIDVGLLTKLDHDQGIKFVIIIKRSIAAGSRQQRKNLLDYIAESCDIISHTYNAEISLYDSNIEYLILGRLPFEEFHTGMADFIVRLNDSGLSRYLRTRTKTATILQPDFADYMDTILPADRGAPPQLTFEELLLSGETDAIEFKSSAYANLKRWLNKGDEELPVRDANVAEEGIVKAVAGMLNSRLQGTVVVGVGERSKLLEKIPAELVSRAEQLLEPYPAFAGDLVLFGMDMDAAAIPSLSWDEFVRQVQGVLASSISPNPLAYIRIEPEIFFDHRFLVIHTTPPDRVWFYVEPTERDVRFYVRVNSETRPLLGRDQDVFKDAHS